MTPKNLMEETQLDFSQPLLSVRRGASAVAPSEVNKRNTNNSHPSLAQLPYYKSDLKSGPVRNPGVIPFKWEQTPGRPKDDNKIQKETPRRPPLAPKLPPGRVVNFVQRPADKELQDSPVSSSISQAENVPASLELSFVDKVLAELEGSEGEKECEGSSSSDDENVTYLDARDTLSQTDFFLNCSVSGISGLDGPQLETHGAFSDPRARDFMMGRFLPAAKRVASEMPQFASRKYPVPRDQPIAVKDMVTRRQSPQHSSIPHTSHNVHEVGKEEEDEEDDYSETEDLQAKLCGLLPRFCLLNPIPGLRDHAQEISSVRSVRTRPPYAGVYNKNRNQDRGVDQKDHLKRNTGQHAASNESSMYGHSNRKGISLYKKGSPQAFFGKERGLLGLPEEPRFLRAGKIDLHNKGYAKFKELSEITTRANPTVEKTLDVDSEQMVDSQDSNSSSSESRGRNPSVDYSLQDIKPLGDADEKAFSEPKIFETAGAENLSHGVEEDMVNDLKKDHEENTAINVRQLPNPDAKEATLKSSPNLVLAPLLPKSPSESWLSRTLPSVSSKSSSFKPFVGNIAHWPSPVDPKRERMLKSSGVHHMLFCPEKSNK